MMEKISIPHNQDLDHIYAWIKMKQTANLSILLLLKLIIVSICVYRSNGFKVRFDNGSEYEGKVEIQYYDDTGTVRCNDEWNPNDTQTVFCRRLRANESSIGEAIDEAYYHGRDNGTI